MRVYIYIYVYMYIYIYYMSVCVCIHAKNNQVILGIWPRRKLHEMVKSRGGTITIGHLLAVKATSFSFHVFLPTIRAK